MPRIAAALVSLVLLLSLLATGAFAQQNTELTWQQLPELPAAFGFGGPLVGTHNGALIVAGGANFPHGPPWPVGNQPAGAKVWHDTIYVLLPGEQQWQMAGRLPRALAYAPVVSLASGMYVLGGESFTDAANNHDVRQVLRLTWDSARKQIHVEDNALPSLPQASSYHAAATLGSTIYVAASHAKSATSKQLDTKSLWALNVSAPSSQREWASLPAWPGPARFKMAMTSAEVRDGENVSRTLFLIGGSNWSKTTSGDFDLARFEFYDDAYRYEPATRQWKQLASLPKLSESRSIDTRGYRYESNSKAWQAVDEQEPGVQTDVGRLFNEQHRPANAAVAMNSRAGQILLFSGSTGRYATMAVQDRPPFPAEVLAYDMAANQWSVCGTMPQAVVTTGAVWWQDRIVIASGETRPGVRTHRVQAVRPRR